ncbi:MAG: squalene/phytoene synthase family protein [Kofleriaceae bacterium]|nr:squalene/phytoene synthase family protein [Kofleriaceae bacterium]
MFDQVIIGAGPVGSLAAHAFARRGARVALLEANPNAPMRVAGEWIHPPGVEVLDRLRVGRFETHGARVGYGFAVLPDDGSPPIELPYPDGGVALACEHRGIVASLRARALSHTSVTYVAGGRAVAITDRGVIVERDGQRTELRADMVVGADGRSSVVARHLGAGEGELMSYMAAVELRGVELPREGFGHVVLGGPGPALLYRLDDGRVRACLDVPIAFGGAARTPQFLWDGFGPALPPAMREGLRRALERGDVMWAATRFRPRARYRHGRVIALGDAVGHCHPLTAIGLTQGFLDAEAAASGTASTYPGPREHESYAAELLANALYHVMRRDDRSASAIRSAMYDGWRADRDLRERSMRLLTTGARRSADFGLVFSRIAATAFARELGDGGVSARSAVQRVSSFRQWLPWGMAGVVPQRLRARYRQRVTATMPMPGLGATVDAAERVVVAPASELDRELIARTLVSASSALARFRSGIIGRGNLATELAHILLAAFESPSVVVDPHGPIDDVVQALLKLQTRDGGFSDPGITACACRALQWVRRAGAHEAEIDTAFARAAHWLRTRQRDDGAQPGPDAVAHSAAAIEAWLACGVAPTDAAVRRSVRWLVRQQSTRGAWNPEAGAAASALATARALSALASVHGPFRAARDLGVMALVELLATHLLDGEELRERSFAPVVAEAVRALTTIVRLDREGASVTRAPRTRSVRVTDEDHSFCRDALEQVSRTFARPIALLPEQLSTAVSCGYLLCRIADTIEDHPAFTLQDRERLFARFLETLDGGDPRLLIRGFEAVEGNDAELTLGRNSERVMRVLASLTDGQRTACRRWIAEMARGMELYVHRPPGQDGLIALTTLADLQRYCYFVAGTVGHLLTDLFDPVFDRDVVRGLRPHAERFGVGLQLVNILKDVTEDRTRGWSYIPRSLCVEHGIDVEALVDVAQRERAHAAVAPVFTMAREHLDAALHYALAVPPAHPGVRLFCLLPLWMAVRTLTCARGNDAMFVNGAEVKISRAEVEASIAEVTHLVADDDALLRRYHSLWGTT